MFRVVFWDILPCKMIVDQRISQKTTLNIILAAVRTWNLTYDSTFRNLLDFRGRMWKYCIAVWGDKILCWGVTAHSTLLLALHSQLIFANGENVDKEQFSSQLFPWLFVSLRCVTHFLMRTHLTPRVTYCSSDVRKSTGKWYDGFLG
jgi:hypothetical protein